mmetsp:Transcript_2458/g.4791  ORF Transcript_2458/g.4791 Transcript_2458/m.4791 type:complete len:249 (+) Transcript_2458:952-1698(+)
MEGLVGVVQLDPGQLRDASLDGDGDVRRRARQAAVDDSLVGVRRVDARASGEEDLVVVPEVLVALADLAAVPSIVAVELAVDLVARLALVAVVAAAHAVLAQPAVVAHLAVLLQGVDLVPTLARGAQLLLAIVAVVAFLAEAVAEDAGPAVRAIVGAPEEVVLPQVVQAVLRASVAARGPGGLPREHVEQAAGLVEHEGVLVSLRRERGDAVVVLLLDPVEARQVEAPDVAELLVRPVPPEHDQAVEG